MTGNDMSDVEPSGGGGSGRVMLVRTLPGLVGESRRVVHIVPVREATAMSQELRAYCGEVLDLSRVEQLPNLCGMPCERCFLNAPLDGAPSALRTGR